MKSLSKKMYTTGQFAKLHAVNKRTLIFYDEIGFFSPDCVKENNYRYYSFQQNYIFSVVVLLRQLGFSLKEIKQYLTDYEYEDILTYLLTKCQKTQRQLYELTWLYKKDTGKAPKAEQAIFLAENQPALPDPKSCLSPFLNECYKYRLVLEKDKTVQN